MGFDGEQETLPYALFDRALRSSMVRCRERECSKPGSWLPKGGETHGGDQSKTSVCERMPHRASTKLDTFDLALMSRGFEASASGHIIEVANCNSSDVSTTFREIAASPPPPGSDLAEHAAKLHRAKIDHFLPDELLKAALAKERLDPESVPGVARRNLNPAD
jgi:hypothetical protein